MKQLSVRLKLAYGVGQVGEQVKNTGFTVLVFFLFNNVLGLSGMLSGLAAAIALAFDDILVIHGGVLSLELVGTLHATAVPEPSTALLVSMGVAGLALRSRGRRR